MNFKPFAALSIAVVLCISMVACSAKKEKTDNTQETTSITEESITDESTSEVTPIITAGTYTASEKGFGGDVTVSVTVDETGDITDLIIEGASETPGYGDNVIKKLQQSIMSSQPIGMDAISGATFTSNAIIRALSAALLQAGMDTTQIANRIGESIEKDSNKKDEKITTQVVVVGCGGSGMSAALAAAEKGANVVIVEQTSTYGGNAKQYANGIFAIESLQQQEEEMKSTTANMFDLFLNYTLYTSNGALTKAFLEKSADTVNWVGKYGNPVTLINNTQLAHQNNIKTNHKFDNKNKGFENWYKQLIDMDVRIIFNTKVTELIKTDDGTIKGVIGTKADGSKLTVNADATILATGGFGTNSELVNEYLNLDLNNFNSEDYTSSGEGILMAKDAGADHYVSKTGSFSGASAPEGTSYKLPAITMAPMLWVDNSGKRFVNEEVIYDHTLWGNAAKSVGGSYWVIVDEATLEKFAEEGSPFTHTFIKTQMSNLGFHAEDAPTTIDADPNIIETFTALAEKEEWAAKEFTIVDLAKKIGVSPKNLTDTIAKYNEAVAAGEDKLFNKPSDYLKYDVTMGPFYAIQLRANFEGSLGGITVNENLEVVRPDATPIPGLYAAGNNVGGIYGNSTLPVEGITLGFAINSGRMAGESAAEFVK